MGVKSQTVRDGGDSDRWENIKPASVRLTVQEDCTGCTGGSQRWE